MIKDAQLRLSNAQALTTGTQVSTNSIDMLVANRNLGRGGGLRMYINADVTFTGGTSVQPQIIESDNADLSSPTVLLTGPARAEAALVAGRVVWDTLMPDTSKKYVGVQYVNVGTHTAGALSAHIVANTDNANNLPAWTGR